MLISDGAFQISIVLYSNLLMLIYIGLTRPLISSNSNRVEMFNELMVNSCCFFVPQFAKFSDFDKQYFYAYTMIGILFVMLFVNVIIILYYIAFSFILICKKYLNILM